jgi:hypothetical protein
MRPPTLFLVFFVLASAITSCHYASPDLVWVPEHPGYQEDVRPLFSDHCLLCHSSPPNRGAPANFRLDVYDDVGSVLGAYNFGPAAVDAIQKNRMPPAAKDGEGVGTKGLLMLQRWSDDGMPKNRP